jgi:hypothetical protein
MVVSMYKFNIPCMLKVIIIPGIMVVSFSHFLVELFGRILPHAFYSFFKEIGTIFVIVAALLFAVTWLLRARPRNFPKNYHLICFDVFGEKSIIDGLRTEFKTNDVAWSFMREYKKRFPLYHFALVVDDSNSEKEMIIRYI